MFTSENGYNYPCYPDAFNNVAYYYEVPYYYTPQPNTFIYEDNGLNNTSMMTNLYGYNYIPNYSVLDKDEANCNAHSTVESVTCEKEEKEDVIEIE